MKFCYLLIISFIFFASISQAANEHEEEINKTVSVNQNLLKGYLTWASVYARQGKLNEAIAEYKKVLKIDPHNEKAERNIAMCYSRLSEMDMAKFYLKKCLSEHPDSPDIGRTKIMLDSVRYAKIRRTKYDAFSSNYCCNLYSFSPWVFMPMKVYIAPGDNIPGFRTEYIELLKSSFNDWAQVSRGAITWKLVDRKHADVICEWTEDARKQNLKAYEGARTNNQYLMLFNRRYRAFTEVIISIPSFVHNSTLADRIVKFRCLHEVGHILGLDGHSPDNKDVMFYSEQPNSPLELSARDIATIRLLYPKK